MAVNSETTCDAVTGTAAPFVTYVEVRVDGEVVASRSHEVTDDGPWWSFTFPLALEGDHTVQVWDRTAGNDYWAEPSNLHHSASLTCAVATTTQAPEPTASIGLETTTVVLNTAPVPLQETSTTSTVPFVFPEDLYSAPSSTLAEPWGPCSDDGSCLPGYSPETTLGEPIGCCSDWVGDTTAEVPVPTLPATGSNTGPVLGVGVVLLVLGLVAVFATRRA